MTPGTDKGLASLGSRLVDSQDREAYAALVSYIQSLPPSDDFRRLGELLGLLALLGQRIPEALGEAMVELRSQARAAAEYQMRLDQRLGQLPGELTSGVNVAAMAESFRQQIASTGLQESVMTLNGTAQSVKGLSTEVGGALQGFVRDYRGLASSISVELNKLVAASRRLQEDNAKLIRRQRVYPWVFRVLFALAIFFGGGLMGIFIDRSQPLQTILRALAAKN